MKKTLLFLTLSVFSFTFSYAQEESKDTSIFGFSKGDIYVSGEFGYDKNEVETNTRKTLNFSPTIGYFVSNHFAFNGGLTFGSSKLDNNTGSTTDGSTFGWTIGGTYIFSPEEKFSFTLGLRGNWDKTDTTPTAGPEFYTKFSQIQLSPGINYFISERIALQINLGVISRSKITSNIPSSDETKIFDVGIDFTNTRLGIVYKF